MIWREGQNHVSDCYFCMLNINGSYIEYICIPFYYLYNLICMNTYKI